MDYGSVIPRLRPPGVSLDTDWPDIAHLAKYRVSGLVRLYGQKRAWIWRPWLRGCRRPPKVWLEVMRWGAAVQLAPRMTTQAIARHLFYTDASHLTHDFRRHFHTTIHEYRAEARWQAPVAMRRTHWVRDSSQARTGRRRLEIAGSFPLVKRGSFSDEEAMKNTWRASLMTGLLPFVVALSCGAGAMSARAVGPEVRDAAGLFSTRAVQQADDTIRNIQKNFRKDLLVETFPGVPDSRTNDYARNREDFFASLVRERAQAARLDGIYVLIMKEAPPHKLRIQVGIGQATRQRAFLPANRDELVRLFQSGFREGKNDEGLNAAVGYVERTLRSNLGGAVATANPARSMPPAAAPVTHGSGDSFASKLILGLLIVGGVFFVIFLIRVLRNGMGGGSAVPGAGGGMFGGGGGGGFFSSLLGGIGGVMAGSWLYDRFFSGNAHANDTFNQNQMDAPPSDVGGDYSSSGGDVDGGSSSGGGDFGSSGGDVVGGGDFGGGGDF